MILPRMHAIGAAGFIPSRIAEALLARGRAVTAVDGLGGSIKRACARAEFVQDSVMEARSVQWPFAELEHLLASGEAPHTDSSRASVGRERTSWRCA